MPVTYRILHSRALHAVGDHVVDVSLDRGRGAEGEDRVVVMSGLTEALGVETVVVDLDLIGREGHLAGRELLGVHSIGAHRERAHFVVAAIETHGIERSRGVLIRFGREHRGAQAEHQHERESESGDLSELFHLLSPLCLFLCRKPSTASAKKRTPVTAIPM